MMKLADYSLKTTALTLALSAGERENRSPSLRATERRDCSEVSGVNERVALLFPLPGGEGQGEGEPKHCFHSDCFTARQRAFTLLELLLAILVFSIVLGAVHVVFFSAFKLRNKTADAIERALPVQQTLAIIKRDLANLVPPGGLLSGALQSTPTLATTLGTSGSMNRQGGPQFYTAVGLADDTTPWGEIERISYSVEPPTNNAPGLDLYRYVSRNLLPLLQVEEDRQFLMSGVESVAFQYYDGNAWKDTWDSTLADTTTGLTNNLPRAIKMELQLYQENRSSGLPAPVELIVPVLVVQRTNFTTVVAGVMP